MWVKICGTTTEEDALLAVAMGADAVGFIFAPSPRQVTPTTVADIVKRLPPEIVTVGVFRDETPQRVAETVHATGLRAAQLHGSEGPQTTRLVRERVPFVLKAFAAGDAAVRDARQHGADAILIDAVNPGSGQVFDWSLAEDVPDGEKLVLAGGLTPANVAEAIVRVHPWGVDVVSGVEVTAGRKDPRKMRAFIAAARAAERPEYRSDELHTPFDWQDEL